MHHRKTVLNSAKKTAQKINKYRDINGVELRRGDVKYED